MLSGNPFDYYRYLPVSPRDRDWGLFVTGAGRQILGPGIERDRHPVGYEYSWESGRVFEETFALLFFVEGAQVTFESELSEPAEVSKGDVVLLCPEVWHRYRANPNIRTTHLWFTFGGDQANAWRSKGLISPHQPILRTGLVDNIVKPFQRLLGSLGQDMPGLQQVLSASVLEIVGAAEEIGRTEPTCSTAIQTAKHILEQQVEQQVDLKELADSVGLSYEKFRHAFTEATGMAPYQYHLQLRVQRAQVLLSGTNLTVQEISDRLNFTDAFHLSKVFKAKIGMPPTLWRTRAGGTPPVS